MDSDLVLVIVVVTALAFDFTNGFHDTANAWRHDLDARDAATDGRGRAAILNFVGAFISLEVAATVASGIVEADLITPTIVFAGLIGAIAWNLVTWWYGLPSSSSHALIGGVVGRGAGGRGPDGGARRRTGREGLIPAFIAPVLAFAVAGLGDPLRLPDHRAAAARSGEPRLPASGRSSPAACSPSRTARTTRRRRWASSRSRSSRTATSANDFDVPTWVVVSSATAIALGTYTGGWRIIRTLGSRIIKMDPAQGFSAQGAGAAVILASSHFGYPLSTTHTISGAVMGAGAAKRLSAVAGAWPATSSIAWMLTLPAAAGIGAFAYGLTRIFGTGALGPIVVSARRRPDPGGLRAPLARGPSASAARGG